MGTLSRSLAESNCHGDHWGRLKEAYMMAGGRSTIVDIQLGMEEEGICPKFHVTRGTAPMLYIHLPQSLFHWSAGRDQSAPAWSSKSRSSFTKPTRLLVRQKQLAVLAVQPTLQYGIGGQGWG